MRGSTAMRATTPGRQQQARALLLALLLAVAHHPTAVTAALAVGTGPLSAVFDGLTTPSLVQQGLLNLPSISSIFNESNTGTSGPSFFLDIMSSTPLGLPSILPTPVLDAINAPKDAVPTSVLKDIMAPVPRNAAAASSAAQGVVGSSLLLAAGICITVAGSLGTGYAGLSEALGLVNGVAGRLNLGMEYAKAGLSLRSDLVSARREYLKAFTTASGTVPTVVQQAANIRQVLTSGNFLPQLLALRTQLQTVRGSLQNIRDAAAAAASAATAASAAAGL